MHNSAELKGKVHTLLCTHVPHILVQKIPFSIIIIIIIINNNFLITLLTNF